ncbi:MAG: hypothetical protein NT138_07370 [Planctomycetales bacterium]|nr:hypothetical protein [Planctomycetales bacterium]
MPKTTYVWDELSDNLIEEYEDGVLSASYTHEPGLYGNLLSQNRNGVTSYYHYDGRGDTVALTDDSGNVTDTKEYDAWGNVLASAGGTITPFQFGGMNGYQATPSPHNVYVRSRHYSPQSSRWISLDMFLAAGRSGYGYVGNNSLVLTDPSGWWEQLVPSFEGYWKAGAGDQFSTLVERINALKQLNLDPIKNGACIQPLSARTAGAFFGNYIFADPDPIDWAQKTPTACAVYSVENLLPKRTANLFSASIGTDKNEYIKMAGAFFDATHFGTDSELFRRMQTVSESGCKPITTAYFVGHSWKSQNLIGSQRTTNGHDQLNLSDFPKYQKRHPPGLELYAGYFLWQSELPRAMNCEFSVPCWFAVDANVTMVGCYTNVFASNFAEKVLRNGGSFARGSLKPTWWSGKTMGWGNDSGTAPSAEPDFQGTIAGYLSSKNWATHDGTN